jgi:hypothetical protein
MPFSGRGVGVPVGDTVGVGGAENVAEVVERVGDALG